MAQSAPNKTAEKQEDKAGATSLTLVDGQAPPLSLTALPLSLTALHTALTTRGIQMPYSSLSQMIALGDIAGQLGVGGKGNRREFPRWSVDFLADFLPWYQSSKINKELAPDAMRHRLTQFRTSENSIKGSENSIVRSEAGASNQISSSQNPKTDVIFYEPGQPADVAGPVARFLAGLLSPLTRLPAAMDNVADAIREMRGDRSSAATPAPTLDRLLTAEQAAELLACNPRSVGRHVLPVLPRKWRESDVLHYIQGLTPIEKPTTKEKPTTNSKTEHSN